MPQQSSSSSQSITSISQIIDHFQRDNFVKRVKAIKHQPRFSDDDARLLWKNNIPLEEIAQLSSYAIDSNNKDGNAENSIYTPEKIIDFHREKISLADAALYASLRNPDGSVVFESHDVLSMHIQCIPAAYIKGLWSLWSSSGEYLRPSLFINAWDAKLSSQDAEEYIDILSSANNTSRWLSAKGTLGEARDLASISVRGKRVFSGRSRVWYREADGTLEYAQWFAQSARNRPDSIANGNSVYLAHAMGISPKEFLDFNDTQKPDAVIIYPVYDDQFAFYDKDSIRFLQRIREEYDAKICVIGDKRVLRTLKIPRASFLMLSGHGNGLKIILGDTGIKTPETPVAAIAEVYAPYKDCMREIRRNPNRFELNVHDVDIKSLIDQLDPDATIYIDSCYGYAWGEEFVSFAPFIKSLAADRRVIAGRGMYLTKDVRVKSIYPFDIRIFSEGKDVTYVLE
jgi:hypothetical protein